MTMSPSPDHPSWAMEVSIRAVAHLALRAGWSSQRINERLRAALVEQGGALGLTRGELARALGVHQRTLAGWKNQANDEVLQGATPHLVMRTLAAVWVELVPVARKEPPKPPCDGSGVSAVQETTPSTPASYGERSSEHKFLAAIFCKSL